MKFPMRRGAAMIFLILSKKLSKSFIGWLIHKEGRKLKIIETFAIFFLSSAISFSTCIELNLFF